MLRKIGDCDSGTRMRGPVGLEGCTLSLITGSCSSSWTGCKDGIMNGVNYFGDFDVIG